MNLFIDSISTPSYICIFDNNRKIISNISIDVKGNESSKIIPELTDFLKNNNISHESIENIVVVNGPGSFTGVRTTVLIANTFNYVINKNMTPISYFDLFKEYPIIKSSSRRDHFVQKSDSSEIEIIENTVLETYLETNNISDVHGESGFNFQNIRVLDNIDYNSIIQELKLEEYTKIEPLYIKKPNIS